MSLPFKEENKEKTYKSYNSVYFEKKLSEFRKENLLEYSFIKHRLVGACVAFFDTQTFDDQDYEFVEHSSDKDYFGETDSEDWLML